ncbi:SAM hydrolase/SAM-dependent halogenase family protein [Faecalibacter rhinopitheci]|uniref:SAM-dependent chlorinase/fluorinase n=1 Tax=Faecalibacter rhinopitheci TaxID=2779678 RepID=A0A8J7KDI9_9FLAO|nr:SAM-dependent chlorinase/fluorinase [Faecalibacter rhinopitheci]MBF0597376.1 SAM-dependent chlorinase/fluorinase [Faecalibacter rhinopitheci]MBQ0148516.1 SAM-dependent chlorinase/fluorinase [Candidatus Onthonaster equi]
MAIITLTTDFGIKDYFVSSVKGAILKELPDVTIIDISHHVSPFDISEAAYIIRNSYDEFPKGSIHIIGVNSLSTPDQRPICARINGHYFICGDNGILSLICHNELPEEIYEITIHPEGIDSLFPVKNCFVPVACHLARGGLPSLLGPKRNEIKQLNELKPVYREDKVLIGYVIYIDHFGNVVTNITRKQFDEVAAGRKYNIILRQKDFSITDIKIIYDHYHDVIHDFSKEFQAMGRTLCVFNSAGFLEVTLYKSNPVVSSGANQLMGLKKGDTITVEFEDE